MKSPGFIILALVLAVFAVAWAMSDRDTGPALSFDDLPVLMTAEMDRPVPVEPDREAVLSRVILREGLVPAAPGLTLETVFERPSWVGDGSDGDGVVEPLCVSALIALGADHAILSGGEADILITLVDISDTPARRWLIKRGTRVCDPVARGEEGAR